MSWRGAGAVFAGILTNVILSTAVDAVLHASGVYPAPGAAMATGLYLLASAYRALFCVAGGWVTARLAPDRPVGHALALGAIGIVLGSIGVAVAWGRPELGPTWYPLSLVAQAIPCSWLGAKLHRPTVGATAAQGGVA